MKKATIFIVPRNLQKSKPYQLEFRQLKEYYNFQRRFKSDKKDKNMQNKWIQNEYYLIDKNWLNKWKELVNYNSFNSNRDLNDNDYNTFVKHIFSNNKGIILSPLDNSNIYMSNGEINPIAEFMVIDKKCLELFTETRKNMVYHIVEKSVPIKFLKDKLLFNIGNNIKIICFKNDLKRRDEEIIIIFKEQKNKDIILSDIEKENFILWLKKRNFELDYPDELEIIEHDCKIKIINRNLKLKNGIFKNKLLLNKFVIDNNLLAIKFNLTNELQTLIQSQVEENLNKVTFGRRANTININDNNNQIQPNFHLNNLINDNQLNEKKKLKDLINFDNNMYTIKPNSNNKIQNMNQTVKKSKSLSNPFINKIKFPHQICLMNIGQACYINATIQCLSNIKSLSNFLLLGYGTFDSNKQPLCTSYSSLLYSLFHSKDSFIKPDLFCEICEKLNPIFEKSNENDTDAKDFFLFVINIIHKELTPKRIDNSNEIDFLQNKIDSKDEKSVIKDFLKKYNLNKTIISDLFYGMNRFVVTCNNCKISSYSFQTFNILIFSLKKIKEYKTKECKLSSGKDLNLYDAFLCEQEIKTLEGEDCIYCEQCKKMTTGLYKNDIYGLPKILIIVLDRGRNNQDFKEEFWFDEILDFSDKNIICNKDSFQKFYLCGIISYIRKNEVEGNYIAYSRTNNNDNFLCYNDTSLTSVSVLEAMTNKLPYILVYHVMN